MYNDSDSSLDFIAKRNKTNENKKNINSIDYALLRDKSPTFPLRAKYVKDSFDMNKINEIKMDKYDEGANQDINLDSFSTRKNNLNYYGFKKTDIIGKIRIF